MAFDTINIGAAPNDGTGDTLRSGGAKINTNFGKAVEGPASATAAAVAAFDGTTGKLIQNGQSLQVTGGKFSPTANTAAGNGMYLAGTNTLAFSTNDAERVRVTSGGAVGIGQVPASGEGFRLSSANGIFRYANIDNRGLAISLDSSVGTSEGMVIYNAGSFADSQHVWQCGGTERLRITSAGAIELPSGSPGITTAGTLALSATGANIITASTNGVNRLEISSAGNIGIGGTPNTRRLSVVQNEGSNYPAEFIQLNATGRGIVVSCNSDDTTGRYFEGFSSSASTMRIFIFTNGNVTNANNSYAGISDVKVKENIVDATPKLEKLQQVRIVNYNLKNQPDKKLLGVVAQEVEQIFPGLIEEFPDIDKEGNDLGTTTKTVKYSVFVPMLIKALQELSAKVEALEAKLEEQSDD